MSHTKIGEITAPQSKFYQGPYGRMFRNLPPHVPTIDLINWSFFAGKLTNDQLAQLEKFSKDFQRYQTEWLIEVLLSEENETATTPTQKSILTLINDAIHNVDKPDELEAKLSPTMKREASKQLEETMLEIEQLSKTGKGYQPRQLIKKLHNAFEELLPGIKKRTDEKLGSILTHLEGLSRVYQEHKRNLKKELNATLEESSRFDTLKPIVKKALEDTDAGREAILKLLASTVIGSYVQTTAEDGDNSNIPAGYTYFGQFITHDITFDPTSSLMRFNDPDKLANFRTPRLDLDSLYGGGPDDMPFLYQYSPYDRASNSPDKRYFLLVGQGESGREADLPRNSKGLALIGDMRNDENVITSQLHLAFIKFHNRIMKDLIDQEGFKGEHTFRKAQRLVRWHYQWVILFDYLPRIVDHKILEDIWSSPDCPGKPKLCYYEWEYQPFIPVEFAVAAFRFGHSMIRTQYLLNDKGLGPKPILHPRGHRSRTADLRGFSYLPEDWTIQWDLFLDIGNNKNPDLQNSRRIDRQLASNLGRLPLELGGGDNRSLATNDLLRGYRLELPSGQAIARAMGEEPLEKDMEHPLWYYILLEAEDQQNKGKLGPVGSRIVAEVIIGLITGDPHSFINVDPWWYPGFPQPTENPHKSPGEDNPFNFIFKGYNNPFELRDILLHAGVAEKGTDHTELDT